MSKPKNPKLAKKTAPRLNKPERTPTLIWLLVIVLAVGAVAWWFINHSLTNSNRQIIAQAKEILDTTPDLAEQMLQLLDGQSTPEILNLLAEAQIRQGKLQLAEETARKWVSAAPGDGNGWEKLSAIQQMQNQIVKSQETLRAGVQSVTSAPQRDSLRLQLIEFSMLADDTTEAKSLSDQLETLDAQNAFRQSLRYAQLLRLNGALNEALQVTQEYLAGHRGSDSDSVAARMLSGIIRIDQQNFQEAADDLTFVVTNSPRNKEAHYKLAMALRGLRRFEEAAKHLKISNDLTVELERESGKEPAQ